MDTTMIPPVWMEMFKGLDISVLLMMAVIAFALKSANYVTDAQRVLVLLGLGTLWGIASGFIAYGEDTPLRTMLPFIFKGILMNSGGAYLLSFAARVGLAKLGVVESEESKVATLVVEANKMETLPEHVPPKQVLETVTAAVEAKKDNA